MKILLFPLFAIAVSAYPNAIVQHKVNMHNHNSHIIYVTDLMERIGKGWSFPCDHPQPKVFPVDELLPTNHIYGKSYFPEETVLFRCNVLNHCCKGSATIVPQFVDKVTLPFKVTYLENLGKKVKGQWDMEYHQFENHTACVCYHNEEMNKPPAHNPHPTPYPQGEHPDSTHPTGHEPGHHQGGYPKSTHPTGHEPGHHQGEYPKSTQPTGHEPGYHHGEHSDSIHPTGHEPGHHQGEYPKSTQPTGHEPGYHHGEHSDSIHPTGHEPGYHHGEHSDSTHPTGHEPDHHQGGYPKSTHPTGHEPGYHHVGYPKYTHPSSMVLYAHNIIINPPNKPSPTITEEHDLAVHTPRNSNK